MQDGIGRKEIFQISQKSARKIKRNGYKKENMSKLGKHVKQWIQDRKHVKGCSFSKPRVADQVRKQKKASGETNKKERF